MRYKLCGWALLLGLVVSAAPAQAMPGIQTVTGQVIGVILGGPATLAPPAGMHQQMVLAEVSGGGIAVLLYRFGRGTRPLPRAFFQSGAQTFSVAPMAGCPATLRALVYQAGTTTAGTAVRRFALVYLPGAPRAAVAGNLDHAPACYVLLPGGGQ